MRWPAIAAIALSAVMLGACGAIKTLPGSFGDLDIPNGAGITSATLGGDGRMWFGYVNADGGPGIGSIGPAGDQRTVDLSSSAYGYSVNDIAVGADGSAWVALACYPPKVRCTRAGFARYSPDGHTLAERRVVGKGDGMPTGIEVAQNAVWISDQRDGVVTRIDAQGRQTTLHVPDKSFRPYGLLVTGDKIYVTGQEHGKLCVFDRAGHPRFVTLPDKSATLTDLALAPDGSVWVAEYEADKIVSIAPDGALRAYAVPTAGAKPDAVAVDAHGVVWFTELETNRIGRIGPDGSVKDALLPLGLTSPVFVFAAPGDMLYVIGVQTRWLGLYHAFVTGRIPEPAALP